ncbi:MAG TPA: hypothetical protein RMH99_32045 [Sandaracinaceae bacterium LLY-WYZ-13_1]|nr:hypothetical protein [Sandaracinaceae bacterium LLY-WYZ-13_1]
MRRLCLATTALLALACNNPTSPAPPPAFDRPESVVFFCWDLSEAAPVPLDQCAPRPLEGDEEDRAEPPAPYALHALVTQTSTGEVAAVRISGDGEEEGSDPGVIDSDVRVPGFTFAAVGEVPSAMAISRAEPDRVYVLSRGASSIYAVKVGDFRDGKGVTAEAFDVLPAGARPSSMVLSPAGDALIAALPRRGELARIPLLGDGELGAAELTALQTDVPEPVDLTLLPEGEQPSSYRYTCPDDLDPFRPPLVPPREPVARGDAPEPWSLLLDETPEEPRLYVADRALPIVHVIDPTTMAELAPLSVSVPTRALAVTPYVPSERYPPGGPLPEATERYLYAIDEIDRSVLVVDVSDPMRSSYGAVLPASVAAPEDRLAVREQSAGGGEEAAEAIAVLSPDYPPGDEPRDCRDPDDPEDAASGANLYGVFLAVAARGGSIRFYDVYDLDTGCRGDGCGANADGADELVAIGRHRPRLGTTLQLDETVKITPDPAWDSDGAGTVTVAEDGSVAEARFVPPLEPLESCERPLEQAYPVGPAAPLVCAVTDPWAAAGERFTVAYEGTIPFTASTGGNFVEGSPALDLRYSPCALGVIGAMDVPADGYLAGYAGDAIAITGDLPPSILDIDPDDADAQRLLDRCEEITGRTVGGETTPVVVPIERASSDPDAGVYSGRLELGDPMGDATLDEVRECFPELLEFEIRAREAFVVRSSRTGFTHAIARDDDGVCVVDPTLAERDLRGRAFFDSTYRSPAIAFRLGPRPEALGRPRLELTVGDIPFPLQIDVSSLGSGETSRLVTLVYNDVDDRLYAIDQAAQGLVRIRPNQPTLTVQQVFR